MAPEPLADVDLLTGRSMRSSETATAAWIFIELKCLDAAYPSSTTAIKLIS